MPLLRRALCRTLLQVVMPIPSKVARRNLVRLHLWHSRYSRLRVLTRDGALLFLTRCTRLFAYVPLSVVLVFYLTSLALTTSKTGVLLTVTLVRATPVSLCLTTH